MLVTLAILNGVQNQGNGHWVNQIINSVFQIFGGKVWAGMIHPCVYFFFFILCAPDCGNSSCVPFLFSSHSLGLIVNDLLNATPVTAYAFWSYLPITIVCWYLVNHKLPVLGINVIQKVESFITSHLMSAEGLQRIKALSTLSFNVSLLFTVAQQHDAGTFWCLPQVAKGMCFCVAVHCASDFFGPNGIKIQFNSCSHNANRAIVVYFWIATKGLSTIGVAAGQTNGLEGLTDSLSFAFGDGNTFLWSMILLDELFGHCFP